MFGADPRRLDEKTRSLLRSNDVEQMALWATNDGRAACESGGRLIGKCTSLRRMDIEGLREVFSRGQMEGFELVLRGIAHNRSIEELLLDGYGPATCHSPSEPDEFVHTFSILSPFFEHNHNFRRLNLRLDTESKGMFAQGTEQLVAALEKCSSLKEFGLECSRDDADEFGGEILTALKNSKSNLTRLLLTRCYSDWNGCAELGELIQHTPLEELDLTRNAIDDEGAELLGRVVGESTTMKTLRFCFNNDEAGGTMSTAGWRAFFEFLKSPTCALETLNLQWGHNDETALVLTDALRTNTTLKSLTFLSNWDVNPEGWCSFFTNLFGNPNSALEYLNCGLNGSTSTVDDSIATSLVNALVGAKSLRTLDLTRFDSIGPVGWQTIISSVEDLVFNEESLGAVLSSNHTLSWLRLDHLVSSFTEHLDELLQLNYNDNKEQVKLNKILRYYNTCNPDDEDDELLVRELRKDSGDLDTKVMPFVLSWAGREEFGSTLLYRLIRRMPATFTSAKGNPSAVGKRKRC